MKIARMKHPAGDKASWTLLTGYALASAKKQASAISEAMESAADIAQQQDREQIGYDDIEAAVQLDLKPITAANNATRLRAACLARNERRKAIDKNLSRRRLHIDGGLNSRTGAHR